jgi:hypothetical protein
MEEIDIIGTYENRGIIFGVVKWTRSKTGLETFVSLKSKSDIFNCREDLSDHLKGRVPGFVDLLCSLK